MSPAPHSQTQQSRPASAGLENVPALRRHGRRIAGAGGQTAGPRAERGPGSEGAAGRRPGIGSKASSLGAASRISRVDAGRDLSTAPLLSLLSRQRQQLGVSRQHFADGILKLPTGFDTLADLLHPRQGNPFHTLLSPHHKGERPDRMTLPLSAEAGGFSTVRVRSEEHTSELQSRSD